MSSRFRRHKPAALAQEAQEARHATIFLSHREYVDLLRLLERRQWRAFLGGALTTLALLLLAAAIAWGLSSAMPLGRGL